MFKINDDFTIHLTRGDAVLFDVGADTTDPDGNAARYVFTPGETVRLVVYGKKNCKNVVLSKSFKVTEETETVSVFLSGDETTIGKPINKPTDYWYDVEVISPDDRISPRTILGYDEDGAKLFRLYPEGSEQ